MTFAVTPPAPTGYVDPAAVLDRLEPGAPGRSNGATGFAATLGAVVDNTQALQAASNELAIAAVTGDLADIHRATVAATRAQLTLETVATVRNKAVDAFTTIMNLQA